MSDENLKIEEVKQSGKWVYIAGYLIYVLAILFGEFMFISLMNVIFQGWNPIFVFFAAAGAIATGLTLAVMPLAKDRWIVGAEMETASWIFWALEIVVMVLNVILAFDHLNGTDIPWLRTWAYFSPASPMLTIVIWGVLFNMHPNHKRRQKIMLFDMKFEDKVLDKMMDHLDSKQADDHIGERSIQRADQFMDRRFGRMLDQSRQYASETEDSTQDGPKNRK